MNYYKQFMMQEKKRKILHGGKEIGTNIAFGILLVALFTLIALI